MSIRWHVRIPGIVLSVVVLSSCGSRGSLGEPFPAESPWSSPARPTLPPEADTNDATAYYSFGASRIYAKPDTAAAAFYWATRLDPWRADAYYARAVALLRSLMAPWRGTEIWTPTRRPHENEMEVIDSLNRVAYDLDPFIYRRYDHLLGPPVIFLNCGRVLNLKAAAMCYLHAGDYVQAVRNLGEALKRKPGEIELHYYRAQTFFRLVRFDSAANELRVLADSLERRQAKKVMIYVSRAGIFYAQGMAYTQHGDSAKAREAYERALVEDLSFHMASVRLSGHALATGDTTAALSHLAHAVTVRPADVPLRLYYGLLLSYRNQRREAADQYLRAIEVNPYYAPPYLHLGKLLERSDLENAITAYHMYLGRVTQADSTRTWVVERLRALEGSP
jgi:tetratricopeptide (TPR) repeat protein